MNRKNARAQSAMEYLMTYGWAIIVILVVLAVLYILNVFNPPALIGNTCAADFKYSCQSQILFTNGKVNFVFGQGTGTSEYNLAFACAAATNKTTGQPYVNVTALPPGVTSLWMYANLSGSVFYFEQEPVGFSPLELDSGQSQVITGLTCFNSAGIGIGSAANVPIGTPYTGTLWVRYTDGPGINSSTNPYISTPLATLSTAVVSSASPTTTTIIGFKG